MHVSDRSALSDGKAMMRGIVMNVLETCTHDVEVITGMLDPDNATLEWCAKWIEDSLRAETNEHTIEFGKNMAMTIRAVRTKDPHISPASAAPVVDKMWEALKAECCKNPAEAKLAVFVSEKKFKEALAPFAAAAATAAPDILVRREDAARVAELVNDSIKAKGKFAAAILMMPPYPAPDCPICGYPIDSGGLCVLDAAHIAAPVEQTHD